MSGKGKQLYLHRLSLLPIKSLVALIGSIFLGSFSPILIRFSQQEISSIAVIFNRFWITAITFGLLNTLLVVNRTQKPQSQQQKIYSINNVLLLILDGVILSFATISWIWSLSQTTIANSSIINNLIPLFTTLGGRLILGQKFDSKFKLGLLIALTGAMLLEVNNLFSLSKNWRLLGDLAALISAMFFGLHPLISEKLRIQFNSITIMTWSSIITTLLFLPIALISKEQLFPISVSGWLSVIALAIFGQVLGIGLCIYCLKKLSSRFVSLASLMTPALSSLQAWVIFSENINFLTLICYLIILLGIYLAISSPSTIKKSVPSQKLESDV